MQPRVSSAERMERLLGIVRSHLARKGLPAVAKDRTVEIVDRILERLG